MNTYNKKDNYINNSHQSFPSESSINQNITSGVIENIDDLGPSIDFSLNINQQKRKTKNNKNLHKGNNNDQKKYKNNKNSKVIHSNPFMSENKNNLTGQRKSYSKQFITGVVGNNFNDNSSCCRTVFSKVSETMYDKTKKEKYPKKKETDLKKESEDDYNRLTEDCYINSLVNKENKENIKIIHDFLVRKSIESTSKKIGAECERYGNNNQLKDSKRSSSYTDRNLCNKSSRSFQVFLKDQNNLQEKHNSHLLQNENESKEKINNILRDRPFVTERSKKIANNSITRRTEEGDSIHDRLYKEFGLRQKIKEKNEKEKLKKIKEAIDEKKLNKTQIDNNTQRLFGEYEKKQKIISDNEKMNENKFKELSKNSVISKSSNEIIYKKFINKYKSVLNDCLNKNIEDDFKISFLEFLQLLNKNGLTKKNFSELIDEKNKEKESIMTSNTYNNSAKAMYKDISKKSLSNNDKSCSNNFTEKSILREMEKSINLEVEKEYKLSKDAWKIITKNKIFKEDIEGDSKRVLKFFLSVLGVYKGELNDKFIKKECPFVLNDEESSVSNLKIINNDNKSESKILSSDANLANQCYKYFILYRNNAIDRLLDKEKENQRILEIQSANESNLLFTPRLEKSSRDFLNNNTTINNSHLSVSKEYETYRKNKELKLKEYEKIKENLEIKDCTFIPNSTSYSCDKKPITKEKIRDISQRLHSTRIGHRRNSEKERKTKIDYTYKNYNINKTINSSNINTINVENYFESRSNLTNFGNRPSLWESSSMDYNSNTNNSNSKNMKKMFRNNPLERDGSINKKIKEYEESRKLKSKEKIIKDKGLTYKNKKININNDENIEAKSFHHVIEPLNDFKNTFKKFERYSEKITEKENKNYQKKVKYVIEIFVENEPKKLVIYYGDNVETKINDFCKKNKLEKDDKKQITQIIKRQIKNKK